MSVKELKIKDIIDPFYQPLFMRKTKSKFLEMTVSDKDGNVLSCTLHNNAKDASESFQTKFPELASEFGGSYSAFRLMIQNRYPAPKKKKQSILDIVKLKTLEIKND